MQLNWRVESRCEIVWELVTAKIELGDWTARILVCLNPVPEQQLTRSTPKRNYSSTQVGHTVSGLPRTPLTDLELYRQIAKTTFKDCDPRSKGKPPRACKLRILQSAEL